MGLMLPAAQAFGTQTGNTRTDKEMSGAEQFATIGKGVQGIGSGVAAMF